VTENQPTHTNREIAPFLPCYADHGHSAEEFPQAHALGEQTLSVPLFLEMTEAQQDCVSETVAHVMKR